MSKKITTDPTVIAEAKDFCAKFLGYCQELQVPPQVALTIMLFESNSSINPFFTLSGGAVGILQFVKEYAGTKGLLDAFGVSGATYANVGAKSIERWNYIKSQPRVVQLREWFLYHKFYKFQNSSTKGNDQKYGDKNPYLTQYIRTLNPNADPYRKDGNGVSANSLTSGEGRTGATWKACVKLAGDLLANREPFPGFDSRLTGPIVGYKAMAAYHAKVGYVSSAFGGVAPVGTTEGSANAAATSETAKPNLSEKLPVQISINIPEYPRFVGMKPGDVVILPETSQLRDWLIVSIERTFNQGLNMLQIEGRRPLDPAPFVQPQLLGRVIRSPEAYYYLS